jgi:hypothetical protein
LDLESKKRLKHVHAKLHAWDKEVLKASKKRLHAYLNEDLEQLRRGPMTIASLAAQDRRNKAGERARAD